MLRFPYILIACLLFSIGCHAKSADDSLWNKYIKAEKPQERANLLIAIADAYDLRDDIEGRDSIFELALDDLHIRVHDTILVDLYNWYFEKGEDYYSGRVVDYAKNVTEIAGKYSNSTWQYYSAYAKANLFLYQFETKNALDNAREAFYHASLTKDPEIKIKSMLLLGTCLQWDNKKVEAFKKFIDALYLSREIENPQLTYLCYQKLAAFYYLIDNREKAKEYVKEQYKMVLNKQPLDSLALIKLDITYAFYLFDNNEQHAGEKITKHVLDYAIRHGYNRLSEKVFVAYRTFLVNNGHFKKLSELYTKQFPSELEAISKDNPTLYYRLKAFILEADGLPDSAEIYYARAEERLASGTNDNVYLSNFYKRYGEFLIRRGKITNAELKLKQAFQHANAAEYVPYLTELSHELDSVTFAQGKTLEAYQYAKLNLEYNKKSQLAQEEEKLLKLEIDNEARERELLAQQEAEATARRYNIQYMGISIVIVLSFIVLAILGSFKVHKVVVKALGFFSFIFFFEFIIMFADHEIHHFTHGEPWKFMLFKIMLIAILLPLHHWLEEKVIHYLVSHRMVDASRMSFSSFFRNLKNNIFGATNHPAVVPAAVDNDPPVAEPDVQSEIVTTGILPETEEKK